MGKFDSFFSSHKLFAVSFIVAVALLCLRPVFGIATGTFAAAGSESKAVTAVILIVLAVILFVSFRKHSDRTMTSVMGAVFMVLIMATLLPFINSFYAGAMNNVSAGNYDRVNAAAVETRAGSDGDLSVSDGGMMSVTGGDYKDLNGEIPLTDSSTVPEMPGASGMAGSAGYTADGAQIVFNTAKLIIFVLYCLMFASHLMIHAGKEYVLRQVRFNQVVTIILLAVTVASIVFTVCTLSMYEPYLSMIIVDIAMDTAFLFILAMIVCVESKLGVYKLRRAELTKEGRWTEEEKETVKKQLFGE